MVSFHGTSSRISPVVRACTFWKITTSGLIRSQRAASYSAPPPALVGFFASAVEAANRSPSAERESPLGRWSRPVVRAMPASSWPTAGAQRAPGRKEGFVIAAGAAGCGSHRPRRSEDHLYTA